MGHAPDKLVAEIKFNNISQEHVMETVSYILPLS